MVDEDGGRRYVALIGDIRGSRQLEDRSQVQEELRSALASLNEATVNPQGADLVITTGDEFQGLFTEPVRALEVLGRLDERFPELSFTFGLGAGGLETDLRQEAVGMDGPCFHEARRAIEAAASQPAGAQAAGFGDVADDHASTMLALVQSARSDWTPTQCRYALALRDAATQQAVADRFDRSKSSISESLSAAHVREVHAAEDHLGAYLFRRVVATPEGGP